MQGRLRAQPAAVLFLSLLFIAGCAKKEEAPQPQWSNDKPVIHQSIQQLGKQQQQFRADLAKQRYTIDTLQQQIVDLVKKNRLQQAQIRAISQRIEKLHGKKRAHAAPRSVAPQTSEAARRPTAPATTHAASAPAKAAPPTPSSPTATTVAPPAVKIDNAARAQAEKNAYSSAYLALKSGRFEEAGKAFNAFLDHYPQGQYVDQAWYWLGETRYAQGLADAALNAFKYVADHYPKSVKHAAALLKLGQIAESLSNWPMATTAYQRLMHDHPDANSAGLAREALSRLQKQHPQPTHQPAAAPQPNPEPKS